MTRTDCRSDGGSGEQIFRPLANPAKLQVSTFTTQPPQGFGLVQRSRTERFPGFGRPVRAPPSAWIEPRATGAQDPSNSWKSRRDAKPTTISSRSGARRRTFPPGIRRISPIRMTWLAEPRPAQGLGRNGRDALRREPRRQTARLSARLRRRGRADRGSAHRSWALRRQDLERTMLVSEPSDPWTARELRARPERTRI
jgi:hypothetical protein